MKILAGIDGTERSYHAVEFASRFLSPTDDISLYFSPPKLFLKSYSEVTPELPEMAQNALAESVFAKATSHLPDEFKSRIDTIVGHSKPCEGILAAAKQKESDLIVIGAHSAKRRPPLFLGGSARKITHESERPVLLVREHQPTANRGLKILVCCDDENLWQDAAESLSSFSWPDNTQATLFQVVETLDVSYVEQLEEHAPETIPGSMSLLDEYRSCVSVQENAKIKKLTSSRTELPDIFHDVVPKVVHGHVVSAIVDEVRENGVDLVVVGARRLGRLGRLLGSTTEGLLALCPCSLLVFHETRKS